MVVGAPNAPTQGVLGEFLDRGEAALIGTLRKAHRFGAETLKIFVVERFPLKFESAFLIDAPVFGQGVDQLVRQVRYFAGNTTSIDDLFADRSPYGRRVNDFVGFVRAAVFTQRHWPKRDFSPYFEAHMIDFKTG